MRFYYPNDKCTDGKAKEQKVGEIWRGQEGGVPSPSPYVYKCIKREVHVDKLKKKKQNTNPKIFILLIFCYIYKKNFSLGKILIAHTSS